MDLQCRSTFFSGVPSYIDSTRPAAASYLDPPRPPKPKAGVQVRGSPTSPKPTHPGLSLVPPPCGEARGKRGEARFPAPIGGAAPRAMAPLPRAASRLRLAPSRWGAVSVQVVRSHDGFGVQERQELYGGSTRRKPASTSATLYNLGQPHLTYRSSIRD